MFRRTLPSRMAMVSTHGGMRRILKRRAGGSDGVLTYIRQAVESGTYRTTEEIDEMLRDRAAVSGLTGIDLNQPDLEVDDGAGTHDLKSVMRRFRQDIVRGSSVVDYPKEYLILRQHPPFPDPPRTPAKVMRRLQRQRQEQQQAEIKPLVQHYLNRQQQQQKQQKAAEKKSSADTYYSSEDYYRRLLGVPAPPMTSMLGQKTAAVQKAYAAAMVHYQLVRSGASSQDDELASSPAHMSQKVDELLKQAQEQQVETCQTVAEQVQQWKKQAQEQKQKHHPQDATANAPPQQQPRAAGTTASSSTAFATSNTTAAGSSSATSTSITTSNILGNDARKVHGMLRWSKRLQAVPYRQWTVGASTALDHWIARQVLKMEEDSWQSLLEGRLDDDDDANDDNLMQMGRQIVAVREALFPETSLLLDEEFSSSSLQDDDDQDDEYTDKFSDKSEHYSVEKKIEELLASLGSMSSSAAFSSSAPPSSSSNVNVGQKDDADAALSIPTSDKNQALVDWTHKLQEWRRRSKDDDTTMFNDWPMDKKNEFRAFVREYTSIAATAQYPGGSSGGGGTSTTMARSNMSSILDKRDHEDDALLQVLLEHPPVDQPDSNAVWNALQTTQGAKELLQTLRTTGNDDKEQDSPDANSDKNNTKMNAAAALELLEFFIGPPSMFVNDDLLSQSEQLDRLLNLGALRPLLDEYIGEEERIDFWKRHGDAIFANVPLEHLIAVDGDENDDDDVVVVDGSSAVITGQDLQGTALSRDLNLVLSPQSRFLLQTMPFRQDASSLLQAWNEHKASRARYEEELFQTGRLGLRYPKRDDRDKAEDSDEDNEDGDKRYGTKRQPGYWKK